MTVDWALAIMAATIDRQTLVLKARREDWDDNMYVVVVDSRRLVYNSDWPPDGGPIPSIVLMKYRPYGDIWSRWSFVLNWKPSEEDRSFDWDLGSH